MKKAKLTNVHKKILIIRYRLLQYSDQLRREQIGQ